MTHTQIMLVSAQAAPNLLAAADTELKPQHAALVVSPAMGDRAMALQRVLAEMGIHVTQHRLRNEHDPAAVEKDLLGWFDELPQQGTVLNLTGGTKLMALAALRVAEAAGWRCFYIDVDSDHVVWLGKEAPAPRKLNEQLRLRHYLGAYGIEIAGEVRRDGMSPAQREFVEALIAFYDRYLPALPQLNKVLQDAEDRRALHVVLSDEERDSKALDRLLTEAERARLLRRDGESITVADEATRDFLKGGWLEAHVLATLASLHGELGIRDRALNLKVRHGGVDSEIDVAFLCRNRLHVIECKTGNLRMEEGARAHEALYKLAENARRFGGLATRGMLVSYRELREPEQRLARLLQIEVVHGREVARLRERLRSWCRVR